MNIVIKIRSADGQPCVKISDDLMKNTGLEDQVRWVKEQLGLLPRDRKSIDYGEKFPGKQRDEMENDRHASVV
jgi:nicotinic acid phosphoribosyltransferase